MSVRGMKVPRVSSSPPRSCAGAQDPQHHGSSRPQVPPLSHRTSVSPLSLPTITTAFRERTRLSLPPPAARGDVGKPPCRPHSRAAQSILLFPWGDDVAPGPLTICVPAASPPSQPSAKNTAGTGHAGALRPKEPPAHSTGPSAAPGGDGHLLGIRGSERGRGRNGAESRSVASCLAAASAQCAQGTPGDASVPGARRTQQNRGTYEGVSPAGRRLAECHPGTATPDIPQQAQRARGIPAAQGPAAGRSAALLLLLLPSCPPSRPSCPPLPKRNGVGAAASALSRSVPTGSLPSSRCL